MARAAGYSHMTSPWQHIMSMRIIMTKWRTSDTPFSLSAVHTHHYVVVEVTVAKLACHGPARYKMEWIYTQTKMSDQGSVELALIMKKKERKKERKNDKWLFF